MAEKENKPDDDILTKVLVVLFILLAITGFLKDIGLNEKLEDLENMTAEEKQIGFISRLFGPGDIEIDETIITKGLISVRSAPSGSVVGTQDKRSIGIVKEGPIDIYDENWWRVDFKDSPDGWVNQEFITASISKYRMIQIVPIMYSAIQPIGILISVILFVALFYVASKRRDAYTVADKKISVETEIVNEQKEVEIIKNKRWIKVEELMESHNVNDWKQAIIEADIILDEMLDRMRYDGETVADKLKNVEESDFTNLNKAWEAHKIRNKIAHGGTSFELDKREAKRVIDLYRRVFQEFYYI